VITEADTCRKYVLPKLYAAGWNDDQISEQKSFTDGRILVVGTKARRRPAKRADYLLRYARDFMLAVVEAKAGYKLPGDGLQQRKITRQFSDLNSPIRLTAMASSSLILRPVKSSPSMFFQNLQNSGSAFEPTKRSKTKKPRADF